jgi:hypothetical protein
MTALILGSIAENERPPQPVAFHLSLKMSLNYAQKKTNSPRYLKRAADAPHLHRSEHAAFLFLALSIQGLATETVRAGIANRLGRSLPAELAHIMMFFLNHGAPPSACGREQPLQPRRSIPQYSSG